MTTGFLGSSASGSTALASNGLPSFGACVSGTQFFLASQRYIELENGDLIRLPPDTSGTRTERNFGYRRINRDGNDAQTQWLLSVQAIYNYLSLPYSSDNYTWFHAQITRQHLYVVMRPIVDGNIYEQLHLIKVDINDGSIKGAYPLKDSVLEPYMNGDALPERFHINMSDDEQVCTVCIPTKSYSGVQFNYGLLLSWDYANDVLVKEEKIWEWNTMDDSGYHLYSMKNCYVSADNQYVVTRGVKNGYLFKVGEGGVALAMNPHIDEAFWLLFNHNGVSMNVVCNDKIFMSRQHSDDTTERDILAGHVLNRAAFDEYLAQSYLVLSGGAA